METECSKRVYQGVRVKHTVKDLLAEKRSRQTSGPRYTGVSSPSPFVQMTGSHMLPSYYSMRRPFMSDTEFCSSTKAFSADVYPSSLTGKSLSCDSGCVSGYSSLIDSYYPESFGDYRSTPFSGGGSTIFSPSALSSLLPPYSSDPSHYLLRDSWEAAGTEAVEGLCGDSLAPLPLSTPSSLVNPESSSPTQFRSSSRGSNMTSSQPYSLHSLDEVTYHSSFQSPSTSFASPSFMSESASKLVPVLPSEDTENTPSTLSDSLGWGKEDTGSTWAQYEMFQSFPPFQANMSADKPKVYQGVRVKTTVKELLQKHRALQAQKTATKSQAMDSRDVCSTALNTHLDAFSGMQAQEHYFQTRPFTENVNIQMENAYDHQQMMHMMPSETFSGSNFVSPTYSQWSNGYLPLNTDIYGTSLVSGSPSDSFNLPSPVDYNSYSPPQSHSSSSSCYSSPTRMDLSSGFSPENYHYQHCNLQHCFSLSQWPDVQEGMATSEYAPYGSSDCLFSYNDDSYFRRDTSNPEMCYL